MRSISATSDRDRQAAVATSALPSARRRSRALTICLTCAGTAIGLLSLAPGRPAFVWNFTASVPVGLYGVSSTPAEPGDILVIAPDRTIRAALLAAGVLFPKGRLLLKPLAAQSPDIVCREGESVSINGSRVAVALTQTSTGAALPRWSGCQRLASDQLFVISSHPNSLDSRYFGPVPDHAVVGVARPVLTLPSGGQS